MCTFSKKTHKNIPTGTICNNQTLGTVQLTINSRIHKLGYSHNPMYSLYLGIPYSTENEWTIHATTWKNLTKIVTREWIQTQEYAPYYSTYVKLKADKNNL